MNADLAPIRQMIVPVIGPGWVEPIRKLAEEWLLARAMSGERVIAVAPEFRNFEGIFPGSYSHGQKNVRLRTPMGSLEVPLYTTLTIQRCSGAPTAGVVFWAAPKLVKKVLDHFPAIDVLVPLWSPNHANALAELGFVELDDS